MTTTKDTPDAAQVTAKAKKDSPQEASAREVLAAVSAAPWLKGETIAAILRADSSRGLLLDYREGRQERYRAILGSRGENIDAIPAFRLTIIPVAPDDRNFFMKALAPRAPTLWAAHPNPGTADASEPLKYHFFVVVRRGHVDEDTLALAPQIARMAREFRAQVEREWEAAQGPQHQEQPQQAPPAVATPGAPVRLPSAEAGTEAEGE